MFFLVVHEAHNAFTMQGGEKLINYTICMQRMILMQALLPLG